VRAGTTIRVHLRNTLAHALYVHDLIDLPARSETPIVLAAGANNNQAAPVLTSVSAEAVTGTVASAVVSRVKVRWYSASSSPGRPPKRLVEERRRERETARLRPNIDAPFSPKVDAVEESCDALPADERIRPKKERDGGADAVREVLGRVGAQGPTATKRKP